MQQTKNSKLLYFFGFSYWKQGFITLFFPTIDKKDIIFCLSFKEAIKKGLNPKSNIYIWGKKSFIEVESYAEKHNIDIFRVEDGFIRSVSLGSDLTKAYSLVVDSRGVYFDPTKESDLEYILNHHTFDKKTIGRAKKLQKYLVENRISKYNSYADKQLQLSNLKENQKVIMVVGQVEDDASIKFGAKGMTNLELLKESKENKPNAYLIYKPHPDVLAGNRLGDIPSKEALLYCDIIIEKASLDSVLNIVDEVHTMTSLVGFEALIRGKEVTTYGLPFYAGWGVTNDIKKCKRRVKKRTLDEVVASTFILYPRYINPKTDKSCEVEELIYEIEKEKKRYNSDIFYKLYINIRNMISRKVQLILRVILRK